MRRLFTLFIAGDGNNWHNWLVLVRRPLERPYPAVMNRLYPVR